MNHKVARQNRLNTKIVTAWLWMLGLLASLGSEVALGSNTLKDINFSALPGNKVQLRIVMADTATAPNTFFVDAPPRLVLDFQDTALTLPNRNIMVGVGAVHSVTALEAGDRTRVVFNFDHKVPYDIQVQDNTILLDMDSDLTVATRSTRIEPPIPATKPPAQPEPIHHNNTGIESVDFHRGPKGEGQVLVTFGDPNTIVSLKEEGKNVIIEALNTKLPTALHQKLDVTDFATPVQSIVTEPKGGSVRISIKASGDYEYVAYQVDKLYTLDFYPLTPEEQEKAKKQKTTYTGEKLTLNFQDISVRTILHLFGDFTDRNMVISDAVQGNITLRLKNVPWDQALDIILKTKFLGKREHDNVIYIAPSADLASQEQAELLANQKIEELAPLKLEFIHLSYADAEDIKAVLKNTSTANTEQKDKTSRDFKPDAANALNQNNGDGDRLLSPRGMITVHKATNSLLIQDTADKLEQIRAVIAKLDVPVQQVLIESRVVIANNSFARDLGVRFGWAGSREIVDGNTVSITGGMSGYLTNTAGISGSGVTSAGSNGTTNTEPLMVNLPVSSPTGAINIVAGKIGSFLLQLELSAMQTEGRGEIVSSPRVITSNNTTAKIEQGTEIPYQEASASGASTTAFKKATLSLDVTPNITSDSRILLKLNVHKDSVNTALTGSVPAIDTRSVSTSVLVDNGETVVLGGVYESQKSEGKDSVPFFGGIPVLGYLFRRTTRSDKNSELLIFVTPKILRSSVPSDANN